MVNLITGLQNSSAALNAERIRMEVISQNIAHANTTRAEDGKPYARRQVVFESLLQEQNQLAFGSARPETIRVARIEKDSRPPRMIYNPGSPDADASGMVAAPNINVHEEMADLIVASRAFEANLAVVKNSRTMAMQSLSIGKRG